MDETYFFTQEDGTVVEVTLEMLEEVRQAKGYKDVKSYIADPVNSVTVEGGEVEVEDKKPEPKDTPVEKTESNVPDWAFDAVGLVDPAPTNAESLLKQQPIPFQTEIPMTSSITQSENFKSWVANNKEEDLANIENSISLDPTNNYSIEQIQVLNGLGVEGAKAIEGIDDVPDDQKSWVIGQINERITKSFANEDGSTPRAAEVFNVLEYKDVNDINKKRDQYVQDQIVLGPDGKGAGLSNDQIKEDIVKYFNNHRSKGIENRIKRYAGEDLYNKLKKAVSQEDKNKVLKEILNTDKVEGLIDEDGKFIDKSRLSDEQKIQAVKQDKRAIAKYGNLDSDKLNETYDRIESKLVTLGTKLYKKGYEDIVSQGNLAQRGAEAIRNIPGFGAAGGFSKLINMFDEGGSVREDFKDLESMNNTGLAPTDLTYLPMGDSPLVRDYNKTLKEFKTLQLAMGLNVDLTKINRQDSQTIIPYDILSEETVVAFGGNTLGINEMQNVLAYDVFEDELGFEVDENVEKFLGERGKKYVRQIEESYFSGEKLASIIPGFTKMGMEIGLTMGMLGGVKNVSRITTGIGDLVAYNMARVPGIGKGAANVFGQLTAGTLQESVGLVGSNTIGSNIFGSEKMAVIPFALGSQIGHLGFKAFGDAMKLSIPKLAVKYPGLREVIKFNNKYGSSTIGGAVKFGTTPILGATAIKGGELTSGIYDIATGQSEMDMSELWHHITDTDSFIETYGALLFMSASHPSSFMDKAVKNFKNDAFTLGRNYREWNTIALDLGLKTKKEGSWSKEEIAEAVELKSAEVINNPEFTAKEADQQINSIKNLGKKLNLKRAIDEQVIKAKNEGVENWNTTYDDLVFSLKSIEATGEVSAADVANLAKAGFANGDVVPILELQKIGFSPKAANETLKASQVMYGEAGDFFGDASGAQGKKFIESGLKVQRNEGALRDLDVLLKNKEISKVNYDRQKERLETEILTEQNKQKELIDIGEGQARERIDETLDYAEKVKAEGAEVKEVGQDEYIRLKQEAGEQQAAESTGYGFQTVKNGKPLFVINKDAMMPKSGKFQFTSGGKNYVIKGFKGSTLKHEVFHPIWENRFDSRAVEQRVKELAGAEGDIEAARETITKQDIEYIDQFKKRLKELGVFNRVEAEMKLRPGYNELIKSGKRNIQIEKEFINEFLELQNEGALNDLVKNIKFKEVSADVVTELKNGADVADYFFTGIEKTPEGKAKVKEAQERYAELVKDGETPVQLSEKKANDLAKEYKNGTIDSKGIENLIEQYNNIGLKALGYDRAKGDIPPKNAVSFINKEFVSILERYDGSTKLSTWINSNIRPKRAEFYEGEIGDKAKTTSIDSETARQVADTSTPETVVEGKESAAKETERQISTFEGKEANRKKKEILEIAETIELQDLKPGVGGAPKKQVGEIGELIFEVPAGKISDPRKNLTFAKKLINLETGKAAKPGEKGVISDSEFGNIQKFFSDKSNMKRFIKTLPETNVTSEQAIINKQGESIDVSREVVGRGIGLPNRIIKYFYEPTGKRSKGLTSQTAVYKLKPEFKNATPETIAKVQGDLLIGKDLKTYDRTVNGQLAKGMAMVEAMKIANEATRSKMPADTKLEKKVIADIKAGASKLSMSEKLIAEVVNKQGKTKAISEILGTKDAVGRIKEVVLGDLMDIGGNLFYDGKRIKFITSGVFSSRSDFKKAVKDKFPFLGDYETGVRNYKKQFLKESLEGIKNPSKKLVDKLTKEAEVKAIEEMKPTKLALDAGLTLQTKDFQKEVKNLFKSNSEKYNKFTPEQIKLIDRVINAETIKTKKFTPEQVVENNKRDFADIEKGKDLILDVFRDVYKKNPKNLDVLAYMLWHPNSNSHPLRNFATIVGKEIGKDISYEEHMLPFSEYSQLVIEGMTKSDKVWTGLKKWLHENYNQEVIGRNGTRRILDHPTRSLDKDGNVIESWSSKDKLHPELKKQIKEALEGKREWKDVISPDIRKYNEYKSNRGYVNPNKLNRFGETDAKRYNVEVDKFLSENPAIVAAQNKLIYEQLINKIDSNTARKRLDNIIKVEGTKEADRAFKETKTELDEPGVLNTSEKMTTEELVEKARTIDKALQMADRPNMPVKKIRIFDFDDTLARTNSKVFAEREGERIELTAEEFAEKGMELIDQGYEMDFTDFNRVVEGKKGPLFDLIKKLKEAPGERDLFILTARAPESQQAIFEFMKAMGVEIPLENITGLGNSTGEAKANWMIDKAAEGYNDFYFADDAPQNVKAARKAMSQLDVKSKIQLAKENKINFSEKKTKELDWKKDEAGNIKTNFTIGKKKYNFNLDARDSKGTFDVEFNLGGRIDMTGTGDAVKVIRTVYNGLLDIVSKTPEIKRLEFSSLKSETSRVKLYTTLMDKVAKKLGWETDIWESNNFIAPEKSSYDFELNKPREKQVVPVEKVLNVIDVKSKVQQARLNTSEKMNTTFNEIIEQSTGIDAVKVFSDVKAQVRGGKKKGQRFFIPPSAEDFLGLLYTTMPKGKKGEKAMKFYQDALLDPYTRAMTNLSTSRVNLMSDFKALKKQLDVPKDLKKETESGFTNEQAVRVYLWNKVGEKIPGLSKTDLKELSDIVEKDPKLKVFADEILSITKGDGYSKPGEGWANGTITTDLVDILNTTKRGKYLETWNENVDVVFSKDNLNKLEAAYGKKYREAVENSLSRMKKGSNRVAGGNRLSNQVLDYINNSTGVTMFINARSALLQTISAANFVNWSFNNPFQAGKAFANQPQFWKDFKQLINSDYLKDRRNGLKLNISESEIANAAKTSKNKAKAVLSYILEKGYAPTKYADSFAIAFGGASYYRNRVKDLMKNKGMSETEANKQALIDWRAESEKSQQSSDPSKISAQQSSDLGRVILQYVNTPMQYARMQKRDVQDIVNKRRIPGKTLAESNRVRVSRIIYYAAIQNLVFNALQQGLFSLGFGDKDISDDEEKKIVNAANGMLDSSLRGLGVGGVTIQVLKNLGIDIYRRSQKDRPEYVDAWIKLLEFSPAIKSKLGRFKSAAYPFDNKKKREEVFEKGFALNNPAYESGAKVITAVTNVPLDRVISKTNNLISAFDEDTEAWMSVAMILGWPEWQLQDKGDDNKKDKKKGPFAVNKNKSNNPFAISRKKADNPFAIK